MTRDILEMFARSVGYRPEQDDTDNDLWMIIVMNSHH